MSNKFNPATKGGNWKGTEYLSYAEHDQCVRATFGLKDKDDRDRAYYEAMQEILKTR